MPVNSVFRESRKGGDEFNFNMNYTVKPCLKKNREKLRY